MAEPQEAPAQPEGVDVYVINYDEEGNEVRLLPTEVEDTDFRIRSRDYGINKGIWRIERLKHGHLIATDAQVRGVNIGSLGRAISGNLHGTELYVDHSTPPIDEDLLMLDERYVISVEDDHTVTAIVTERFPTQPVQSAVEIKAALSRITGAYGCRIREVRFLLPGGTPPEELIDTLARRPRVGGAVPRRYRGEHRRRGSRCAGHSRHGRHEDARGPPRRGNRGRGLP